MSLEEKLAIERRLAEITARDGRLTPEAVVEDAKDKASPFHAKIFRDSDREAAYQHRLNLARQIIRSVRVQVTVEQRRIEVVGYVADPSSSKSGYVATATLINEREKAAEVLLAEFSRIEGAIRRARSLADVLGLRDDLEAMLANLNDLISRARAA